MMNFRVAKRALVDLFGAAANGRYTVIGYEAQGKDAAEIKGNKREVQVYYTAGEFNGASRFGDVQHHPLFTVGLSVSEAARGDLSVLALPNPTPQQVAAALGEFKLAGAVADDSWDELAEIVYQILMDARNEHIGMGKGKISSTWVESIHKDAPAAKGNLVTLTGVVMFRCQLVEEILGDEPVASEAPAFSTGLVILGDTAPAGVKC